MKPVEQTITELGSGNCFAACVASILECSIEEVPSPPFTGEFYQWLAGHGLALLRVLPEGLTVARMPRRSYYIMSAISPRADVLHAVVCQIGRIIWDPHPQREMGVGDPAEYIFLIPIHVQQEVL